MTFHTRFNSLSRARKFYEGKRVLVIGGGRSGMAAARLVHSLGARVRLIDERPTEKLIEQMKELTDRGIECFIAKLSEPFLNFAQEIILSPGVPLNHPFIEAALMDGVPVRSELEVAARLADSPIIAVTGTDGKSTTTAMIRHVLQQAGLNAMIGGNFGIPFSEIVASPEAEDPSTVFVVEVSSYQLEHSRYFHPRIAVILNVKTDHLSRHGSLGEYIKSKALITRYQGADDHLIVNADDPVCLAIARQSRATVWEFSSSREVNKGAYCRDGRLFLTNHTTEEAVRVDELLLPGEHNIQNALAAMLASFNAMAPFEALRAGLTTFQGLEHRIEFVSEIDGVRYFNDSKATTVHALDKALRTFAEPIVLIAGGLKKLDDYEAIRPLIQEKVKTLILTGKDASSLAGDWKGCAPILIVKSMKEAVETAASCAVPGDVVLLSPACTSFDRYSSFEERGLDFKKNIMFLSAAAARRKLEATAQAS
ncbi:MAG: UDP-N-acetylmuramoyl-L-alanine--D-glutamate ligase [Candidatus Sumerlaeia bacterium]